MPTVVDGPRAAARREASAAPSTDAVQPEGAASEEREALMMARSLQRLGAPPRDVEYALDRAETAAAKRSQLRGGPARRAKPQ